MQQQLKERSENMGEKQLCKHQEEGEDMVPEPKQIPCTIVKTRVRQLCPVWRSTVKQRSCSRGGSQLEKVDVS